MTENRVPTAPQPHNHDPSLCPECSRIASAQEDRVPHPECIKAYHGRLLLTGRTIMSVARVRDLVAASEQPAPPLDVERLRRALERTSGFGRDIDYATRLAAEYERLARDD